MEKNQGKRCRKLFENWMRLSGSKFHVSTARLKNGLITLQCANRLCLRRLTIRAINKLTWDLSVLTFLIKRKYGFNKECVGFVFCAWLILTVSSSLILVIVS